ncbi:DUF4241 domain-containing protein [Actinoplanes sp. TBRC 11911]|uniref:DUF4241 domain-containing protein n=1 Tax=Actinoplanes sp. TBRC 11911 TaxID=2729386 RepID=UPI00145EEDA1|nr:DUF4241 domain-containing protein [Actinoplanes sp. TBRC 11911]NMO53426.1 DUF4241 domain-containing protein [Actinoplanes sp. TBRC 11911]
MAYRLEAVYCDGWDAGVINPVTPAAARARDTAGNPYTVVLLLDGLLHAVLDLSWSDAYCLIARFDADDRQLSRHLLRGTGEGDLFLREVRTWDGPPGVGKYEFPHVAARTKTTYGVAGPRIDIVEPRGDLGTRQEATSAQLPPRLPLPAFGRWERLLALAGDPSVEIVDAERHRLPVRSQSRPPWRPPRPLRPQSIEQLFVAGTIVEVHGRQIRLSVHNAGALRVSSGRVIAADPSSLDYDAEPFTVTVPPGSYPVSISLATFTDDPGHSRVCAVRLDVGDQPPVRWELALREGQSTIDLGYGEFLGFGVDAGMACFVDAEVSDRLKDRWRTFDGLVEPRYLTVEAGAMVAWSSGWGDGSYPIWIGYEAGGAVSCFIADMLLFAADDED